MIILRKAAFNLACNSVEEVGIVEESGTHGHWTEA